MKTTKQTGVNLGGWLVLEKWMTPQVFAGSTSQNEYGLAGTATGRTSIERHHSSFIQETDFTWLKAKGVTAVRIPIGYWIFGDEPPYVGAIQSLDWAIEMACKYDMKVLIDLHGAPGAQNAADHSGSGRPGISGWLEDTDKQERTIQVLERLAKRYYDQPTVWGIELLNEPLADRFGFKLIRFYRQAYARLLRVARPGLYVVFSDGFKPFFLTGALWRRKKLPVAIDCHLYQCFDEKDQSLTLEQHLQKAARRRWLVRFLGLWQLVIVGEWSGVLPWTLLKSLSKTDREKAERQFIATQLVAHKAAICTYYWNYTTEKNSGWNLRSVVERNEEVVQ